MQPIVAGALSLLLVSTLALSTLAAQVVEPSAEAAVRSLIARYADARDARDEAAIAALFTPDADQYTTAGEWRRGRDRVVAGTAESTKQNPGDRRIDIQAVRFVTPEVAVVDGRYVIAGSSLERWTTILVRRDGPAWRIAAIRNMAPTGSRPAAAP